MGPLSATVSDLIAGRPPRGHLSRLDAPLGDADPYGLDLQLALHVCYELHYRGFAGVDSRWEWNAGLLHLRAGLEQAFEAALQRDVPQPGPGETALTELDALSVETVDGEGLPFFLRDEGTWEQMREYFVHRSIHHLREGDPHAWLIPRLSGRAKAALVAAEHGSVRGDRPGFADLLSAARLRSTYLAYLNHVPAEAHAAVNVVSMFGLHRAWRGAAVGHFASMRFSSPPRSLRLAGALERLAAPAQCARFYAEHVAVDASYEQAQGPDVVDHLLAEEPKLDRDVVFGMRSRDLLEERLAAHLMKSWVSGRSSLRRRLV